MTRRPGIRGGLGPVTLALALVALPLVTGCRPDDQRTDSADPTVGEQTRAAWSEEMREHIDFGNMAIREDEFALAREHFLAATGLEPDVAAGWFGLYLAEQGLGNAEAAAAALERARAIASGASLIREDGESR